MATKTLEIEKEKYYVQYCSNWWRSRTGTKVKDILEAAFGIPTRVENDVKCAALGESNFGAGIGVRNYVCLTYGTGVGGAIVSDGKLCDGASFAAGQFGALLVHPEQRTGNGDFYAGGYEKFASTTALVQKASQYDPALTNGKQIFAQLGNDPVREIIDNWIDEIVLGLCSIVHILNPAMVILGGGIMEQHYIPDQIRQKLIPCLIPTCRNLLIRSAALGNRAGLFGAAALWISQSNSDA